MKPRLESRFPLLALVRMSLMILLAPTLAAQDPKPAASPTDSASVNASLIELQSEVRELKDLMQQLKQESTASRAEITRLRQELESDRSTGQTSSSSSVAVSQLDVRVGHLEDDQQLLSGKVDEQYQTKVESGSKYRVRFSGVALFNLFSNQGTVDNLDVPTLAYKSGGLATSGSFGGPLRQSIFGFEVFGPQLIGARTSGAVNFDIGGGFPYISNGVNSGLVRLRTATMRLDWKNTDVVAGQDQLFFSPNSPTSFASLIVPALSYSGNLWAWTPQIRVEHRMVLSDKSTFTVQGGILDNLTGEPPYYYTWYRTPQAGERSPAAWLRRARRVFASGFRTHLHRRNCRLLQSAELRLQSRHQRLRRHGRLESSLEPLVYLERIFLSWPGHWRIGRGNRT